MLIPLNRADPLLELGVERIVEAIHVALADRVLINLCSTNGRVLLIGEPNRASFHNDLTLDGVAELDVDVNLIIDQDAILRLRH